MALKSISNIIIPQKSKEKSRSSEDETKFDEKKVNIEPDIVKITTIDNNIQDELERESNKNYDKVVAEIVDISKKHLNNQNEKKSGIRKKLIWFFIGLLSFQMLAVVTLIALSSVETLSFVISDFLLATFITSVFIETLGAMIIMVSFAFGSKEEVEVVGLLTEVIKNYQKYNRLEKKK